MQAVISGNAGRALVLEGDSLRSFDVDDPSKLVPRRRSDLPHLFGEMKDLRVIETSDIESVRRELKVDSDSSCALDLTLISLDSELPDEIRGEALERLDELLVDDQVIERLENILYARPLPEDADLARALELCERDDLRTSLLLRKLGDRQALISEANEAWNAIPTKTFGDHERRDLFQHVAVTEGLHRALVIANETQAAAPDFLLTAGRNESIKQLPNYRQVLQHWASPFSQRGKVRRTKRETHDEPEVEISRRRKRGRRVGIDRPRVLHEVNQKKGIIVGAIHRRDLKLVSVLIDDLVAFQLENGENEYAARSLSDLAMEAKSLGMFSLQLELTERSVTVAPDDGWAWAQHGDALLNMNRIDKALEAYQQASDFGAGIIALAGRAEVLKTQGQLPAALAVYDAAIREYPDDVVARNGRAEVLKAQGQLPAALAAFDEVIREHPENVIAKTGRAEVLKAQGQLPAALAAFDEVIRAHPEDVVARNGRAAVLKAQGQLPAALAAFDKIIRTHPEDVFAKTGRAEVLKAQGQLPAALAAFDEIIREHPENVIAKTGRAEVLKAQGQLPAALAAFDEIIRAHPEGVFAKTGRAEVLKAQGQLPAALAAFDKIIREHPENVVARSGRAEVLKAQGSLPEAVVAYDEILLRYPHDDIARNGRSCVLAALERYDEALESLPTTMAQTLEDWIGYHIRGMVLLRMGKRGEAIRIFQEGMEKVPWPAEKDYFIAALALAWMRSQDFKKASDALERVESVSLQPAANVLRIHAFGAQGDQERAKAAYESLTDIPYLHSNELTLELRHQYIFGQPPRRDEEWINAREDRIILLAA